MSEAKKKTTVKKTARKPRINKVKAVETPNLEQLVEGTSTVEEISEETTIIEEVNQETPTEKSKESKIVEEFDWDLVSKGNTNKFVYPKQVCYIIKQEKNYMLWGNSSWSGVAFCTEPGDIPYVSVTVEVTRLFAGHLA